MMTKALLIVMSHLSDAQELLSYNTELANERINFAKYIMIETSGNLNLEIDPDELWEKFKNR